MGLQLKKYEPLPDLTVQGNNFQAPNMGIAPNVAPAQNISVPTFSGPGRYSWSTPPQLQQPPLGAPGGGGVNLGHWFGSSIPENFLNAPEQIANSVRAVGQGDINREQALGSVGNALLNSAGWALPLGKGANLVKSGEALLPRIIQGAKTGAKLGAGFGVAGGATGAMSQGASPAQVAKSAAISGALGTGAGLATGAGLPVAGAVVKHAVTMPRNEAGFINLRGENVGNETPAQQEARIVKMHQKNQNSKPPKVSANLLNLQNRYEQPLESTNMDQIISQSTGLSKGQITNEHDIAQRKLQAEALALNHLKNGGTRDEAADLFMKATGTTKKDALYNVQRIAKEAKTSLNVSPKTPNPLLNDFKLPTPEPGDFNLPPANRRAVGNSMDFALKRATAHESALSPKDTSNFWDYFQGVKDVNKAENPAAVKSAMVDAKKLFDTGHALGENFGKTPHIDKFVPGYYERTAATNSADLLKAEQAAEEDLGTEHWNTLTPEEKSVVANDYMPTSAYSNPRSAQDINYGGFHNKSKVYRTQAEAIAAGETPLYTNPFDVMRRYATGAKLQLGDQAMIQGVRAAEPNPIGQRYAVNLPGGGPLTVGKVGIKALKNESIKNPPSVVKKALRSANTTVVKGIVTNPAVHGANQEFNSLFSAAWQMPGNKVANMGKILHNQFSLKGVQRDATATEFYAQPDSYSPNYGKDQYGFIAKGLQKAEIDPAKAEWSPRTMAKLEENIRLATYKQARDSGMSPQEATALLNKKFGGPKMQGDMSASAGLFLHYFMTNVKLLGDAGVQLAKGHPYPLIGLAVGYAAWQAGNKIWQDATGNPSASIRAPGALGTAIQLAKAPGQLKHGQIPTVVKTHTNPILTLAGEEIANRDASKPVVGPLSQNNNLDGQRLKIAGNTLAGPGLTIQNVAGAKSSIPEAATGYLSGLYTPHARGYQAAPKISLLNTKNAQPGTGLDQQKQYFAAHDQLLKTVYGDKRASDAVNSYLDRNKNGQGQSVQLNPEESLAAYKGLAGNTKALAAVQKFEKAQGAHPPMWDLSSSDLKSFLDYEGTVKTDPTKAVKLDLGGSFNGGEGLSNFITRNSAWYSAQPPHPGSSVPAPGTPTYPNVPSAALSQYGAITDSAQKAQFLDAHPEVIQAFNDIAKYNNQLGVAQGGNAVKNYPEASTQLQSYLNNYTAASKAQRTTMRKSSPQQYQNMIAYFDSVDLYNINKTGAKDQYQGEPDQTSGQNKAISSLAKDIYKSPQGTYSIAPAGWMQGLSNSGSSSGYSSAAKRHYVSPRSLRGQNPAIAYDKIRGKKVSLKGKGVKGKVLAKGGKGRPTVSIKPSLV